MKWRRSVIYLFVFVLLGGYYSFEVAQERKEQREKERARQVFRFEKDQAGSLEILRSEGAAVKLEKADEWKIVEPVEAQVDRPSLEGFWSTLSSLEKERDIAQAPGDPEPYGLKDPPLKIRFGIDGKRQELLLGEENPSGESVYAKTGDSGRVFLVSQSDRRLLDKGLDDLRRRDLFTFASESVQKINVAWDDNVTVTVSRKPDGEWSAPEAPGMKIASSKVEELLDQLRWLRAEAFLDNDAELLKPYGLQSPRVRVGLDLKGDARAALRVGELQDEAEGLPAISSELPAVVQVSPDFVEKLPRSLKDLEERLVLDFSVDEVQKVEWRFGDDQGSLKRTGESEWRREPAEGDAVQLREPWRVTSLLWELKDAEYVRRVEPAPEAKPAESRVRLTLHGEAGPLQTLSWKASDKGTGKNTTVWKRNRDEKLEAFSVEVEILDKIKRKFHEIGAKLRDR